MRPPPHPLDDFDDFDDDGDGEDDKGGAGAKPLQHQVSYATIPEANPAASKWQTVDDGSGNSYWPVRRSRPCFLRPFVGRVCRTLD